MDEKELRVSLEQYSAQLSQINEALIQTNDEQEKQSLLELKSDLEQLVSLTKESLEELISKAQGQNETQETAAASRIIDNEYAQFMAEMEDTGAFTNDNIKEGEKKENDHESCSDIEDELSTLQGMKCAVYHTHKWGGQPTLHNAMVSTVEPREETDQFKDLQVRVLFTHPTHAEMLPCPFYLDGDCRFNDEQCRYSHGEIISLSKLQDAIEPDFGSIKSGSRVLVKLKPPGAESTTLTKKSSEKYHLWHSAVVRNVNLEKKECIIKLEHSLKAGEKRKADDDEFNVSFETIFPLGDSLHDNSESEDSLSDTEYSEMKAHKSDVTIQDKLIIEKSLQSNGPAMGEWEKHTRGIGSKLMFAMGYVAGTGLGSSADGRLEPVQARLLPVGKSLDHCMNISQNMGSKDPLKVEQRLKRLQKKEEERSRKAYEREQEKERRNVFNFLNKALGVNKKDDPQTSKSNEPKSSLKQSSVKDLNIEEFKIAEEALKVEKEVCKLKNSLYKHAKGSNIHKTINGQLNEKICELEKLRSREKEVRNEQKLRKDKQKLTLF